MKYLAPVIYAVAVGSLANSVSNAGVPVGTLTCETKEGWAKVTTSSRKLPCLFHAENGKTLHYLAIVSGGMEVGYVKGRQLTWQVEGPKLEFPPAALQGKYVSAGHKRSDELKGGVGNLFVLHASDAEKRADVLALDSLQYLP